ncbi:MAG: hypothetical protein ACNI3A_10905 [Desulfovibrio sp.]|uniref:hypothetical protein n=1 Tax=Desulfovibrio sp. 7SRBS1 TaxID=3378064 RepID=UPI003B40EC25
MSSLLQEISACATGPAIPASNGGLEMEFVFPSTFSAFNGHFPNSPIVPGMVQIMAAILTVSAGRSLQLVKVSRSKFTRIVTPDEPLKVVATSVEKAGRIQVSAQLSCNDEAAASLTLFLEPTEKAQ